MSRVSVKPEAPAGWLVGFDVKLNLQLKATNIFRLHVTGSPSPLGAHKTSRSGMRKGVKSRSGWKWEACVALGHVEGKEAQAQVWRRPKISTSSEREKNVQVYRGGSTTRRYPCSRAPQSTPTHGRVTTCNPEWALATIWLHNLLAEGCSHYVMTKRWSITRWT